MSDATCAMMFAWERCTHDGIGQPGCPVCDPDKSRVMLRAVWLDKRDARADLAKAQARVAELEAALRGVTGLVESLDEEYVKMPGTFAWVLQAREALASDGTSALAAVRLAQRALDLATPLLHPQGEAVYVVRKSLAALDQAFGSET